MAFSNILDLHKGAQTEFLKNSPRMILMDFYAPACAPCRALEPTLNDIAAEYKDRIQICKVNIVENTEIATSYNIKSIPAILLIKKGELKGKAIGFHSKSELIRLIESADK